MIIYLSFFFEEKSGICPAAVLEKVKNLRDILWCLEKECLSWIVTIACEKSPSCVRWLLYCVCWVLNFPLHSLEHRTKKAWMEFQMCSNAKKHLTNIAPPIYEPNILVNSIALWLWVSFWRQRNQRDLPSSWGEKGPNLAWHFVVSRKRVFELIVTIACEKTQLWWTKATAPARAGVAVGRLNYTKFSKGFSD